jgi:selenophosphate synthetase-related protein
VAAGGRHVAKVTVQADTAGIYYANVVARMITQVQTEARTFSVPVVVGTVAPAQQAAPVTDAAGEAIEPLPSVENGGKEGGGQQ